MLSKLKNLIGSIAAKVSALLLAMGALTIAAVSVSLVVFGAFGDSLQHISQHTAPNLRQSSDLTRVAGEVGDGLSNILVAGDAEEMAAHEAATADAIAALRDVAAALEDNDAALSRAHIDHVGALINRVVAARSDELTFDAQTVARASDLSRQAAQAGDAMVKLAETAFEDLAAGGEQTVDAVSGTLDSLVNQHFRLLRLALDARAETYLLSGTVIALSETSDPAIASMLRDVAASSIDKLQQATAEMAEFELVQPYMAPVAAIDTYFSELAAKGFTRHRGLRDEIIAMRQESDAALSSAIDDITFELTIQSEDAASANEAVIRGLLDNQVRNIRETGALDQAVSAFFADALNGAAADDVESLDAASERLAEDAARIAALGEGLTLGDELKSLIAQIVAHADGESGLLALRRAVLEARTAAAAASRDAAAAVGDITERARSLGASAVDEIIEAEQKLQGEAAQARQSMMVIAAASLLILVAAPFVTYFMIVRPLLAVTRVTERLARGDLAPVEGFDRQHGEIARMAAALRVFRDGLIERTRLQKEEAEREAAEHQRALREERSAREREEHERRCTEQAERQRREREAAEAAAREEIRATAEAERKARAAEQEHVVSELAEGMRHLAAGRLDFQIESLFPDAYEQLRIDFNAAVASLSDLIRGIADSADKIDLSSGEIAAAAQDLSRRTESSAATLEQTAASLNELTASVTSTAEGADQADRTVRTTKTNAEKSSNVVREAVSAMAEIEESSRQIAKIIDVIDDIAFQTNLLALNAGVEAARAGDAGRGFAVVASEVRALAQRSSEAAREINALISSSNTQVERGVALVDQAGEALQSIILSIGEISRHVGEIAVSAREQATGITEINSAASQLDEATQQNAAMFEESTAASGILTEEAKRLAEMVSHFTVAEDALRGGMRARVAERLTA